MNQYFMPIYTTIVGTVIGLLIGWVKSLISSKKQEREDEDNRVAALVEGMAILLRKQLYEYYSQYEYQDSIPASEWSDIEQTHKVYNKLGGNHTGDRLFESLKGKHIQG